jgi:hypothetical protein
MQPMNPELSLRTFAFLVLAAVLAGCSWEGDGPKRIPGTPAPPPPDIPPGFCDVINFEEVCGEVAFDNFAGGVSTVVDNPDRGDLNPSAKVARMQKFAGEVFGGSTLLLGKAVDFSKGQAFTMKVWSPRQVPVLFKLEGLGQERSVNHSGGSAWQELCFDFRGSTSGPSVPGLTIIFDITVLGNANTDPANWTFFFDDIKQVADCGGATAPVVLPVDFEGPGPYVFSDFEGGVGSVIANPVAGGINTSANVGRMQKFAGATFAGSTLSLSEPVDFSKGPAFTMKVWSPRPVPVLFKFEGLNQEKSVSHSGGSAWETLCFDFTGLTSGSATSAITFIFDNGVAGNAQADPGNWTFYFDDITQVAACGTTPPPPAGFPTITFDDPAVTYTLDSFGGTDSAVAADPVGGANQVARVLKTDGAETWAGTTVSTLPGNTVPAIPFTATDTRMTVRVYSPDAGIPVLLKVENAADGGVFVETLATTTMANAWETLTFDFANPGPNDQPLNPASTYNRVSVFFNFGTAGTGKTYYFDDLAFGGGTTPPPPGGVDIDFDGPGPFEFDNFAGGVSTVIANPDQSGLNTSAQVARMQKFAGEVFGGSTLPLSSAVDFSKGPAFTMLVWSSRPVPVLFKLEGLNQERSANHSGGSEWQLLCFDFTGSTTGAPANGITFIFDLGVAGDAQNDPGNWTFYFDAIEQVNSCATAPPPPSGFPTITFDDPAVTYTLTDFGGNASVVTNDPVGGTNNVVQVIRGADAQDWAGTTVSTLPGDTVPAIPFTATDTRMTVRVYAPAAGIPVLLKVENAGNPGVFVETLSSTTVANAWETLTFDFANPGPNDQPLNLANTYNRVSVFFNFGTTGAVAGVQTYYFDDVAFGGEAPPPPPPSGFPTITFDDPAVTYTLTDFGGNASVVTNDPVGGTNNVVQVIRGADAQDWAGTTVSTLPGDTVPAIPFTATDTRMTVRVYAPAAGIPVLLKVENAGNPGVFVETLSSTTVANAWETLTFDFANPGPNDQPLNLANTYNRVSVFFNFGTTGAVAGVQTYYFDDVAFGGEAPPPPPPPSGFPTITFDDLAVTYTLTDFGGNASVVTNDPVGGTNNVVQVIRGADAQDWAGTTVSTLPGDTVPAIPFTATDTRMTVRVYAPAAGIPVLLKVENAGNPGVFVETLSSTTVANAWETLTFDFANPGPNNQPINLANTYNRVSVFFNFGTTGAVAGVQTYYFDDVAFGGEAPPPPPPPPGGVDIDFDGPGPFEFDNFAGGVSTVIANPDQSGLNTSAQVARMQKFAGEVFGGSTLPLSSAVDFSKGPAFTMLVWSSRPVPVLFKLEGLNQERSANHSGGSEWQLLCFDFTGSTTGAPANGITFIFDLGVAGDAQNDPDNWTFYFDAIEQVSGCTPPPPPPPSGFPTITFDDPAVTYTLTDFGGNASVVTNDPVGGTNNVVQVIRGADAQDWAGTTVSTLPGDTVPAIPFTATDTRMTVRVYAPAAGIPVLLKVENAGNPGVFVETLSSTTVANAWETLTFDFANPGPNDQPLNLANTYNRVSVFFNFGTTGAVAGVQTYYFDDVAFGGEAPPPPPPPSGFPTITFDDLAVTYTLTDFGGNASVVTNDPVGGTNNVVQVIRGADAQDWAGTTVSTLPGDTVPAIPFTATDTRMTVRVYAPAAGIPVLLKVENAGNPGVFVETLSSTTVANAWETLTFDFANPGPNDQPLNLANTYNRVSVFFNFGTTGAVAGVQTFWFDDVAFGP